MTAMASPGFLLASPLVVAALAFPRGAEANVAPTAPVINSPNGIGVPTTTPALRVDNAFDPDGDVLRYQFEIFRDPGLSVRVAQTPAAGVAEGMGGLTSWQVTGANPALTEDHWYYWRARATDGTNLDGPWSGTGWFFINLVNDPPLPPSVVTPQNGSLVASLRPTLIALVGGDADLDPLVFDWDVARGGDFSDIVESGADDPAQDSDNATFRLAADLTEDAAYCWRVRADDGQATSAYAASCFRVSTRNDPPALPAPRTPSDRFGPAPTVPLFTWDAAADPEQDDVTYQIQVEDSDGTPVGEVTGVSGTITSISVELIPGAHYAWRVRATDRNGASSGFSPDEPFTVGEPLPDDGCCQADAGCQAGGSRGAGGALGVGLGLALITLVRRRRRPRERPAPRPRPCR